MLEQDHGEHSQKVQSKAQELGVTVPQEASAKQKATYDRLSKLSGEKFDSLFVREMVSDHKKDIGTYEMEAKSKSSLADFAKERFPPCNTTSRPRKRWKNKNSVVERTNL
jgi:putative membrane protein